MTIAAVEGDLARCHWFVDGVLHDAGFALASLKTVPRPGEIVLKYD